MSSENQLPPLCAAGRHRWAFHTVPGCGATSGDHATDEALVMPDYTASPGPGAACDICFLLWGETQKRSPALVAAWIALSAW